MVPPAGQLCTLGVDPGIRTGCTLTVVSRLGEFVATDTIYSLKPKQDLNGSVIVLERLFANFNIKAIAIGNGTGGRDAEAFIRNWLNDSGCQSVLK